MKIDVEKCVGCQFCVAYCPIGAIMASESRVSIDQDACVKCGAYLKSGACREVGIEPYTVNMSLGTWGRTELLPEQPVLELTG